MRCQCSSEAHPFRHSQVELLTYILKADHEIMNKYRMIEKHDRTVSVPDDGNENMIVVSEIQKNDKVKNEV